jgi:capsid assembly protease
VSDLVDLRGYARALLAVGGDALAIAPSDLRRIADLARSDVPVLVDREAPDAARRGGRDLTIEQGVAVLSLQGVITPRGSFLSLLFGGGFGGLEGFKADLDDALTDDAVEAIVLDVHSPGGVVSGVPEAAAAVREARGTKPIVASINYLSASAAYWIAAQADEVVIAPSGLAGSIGVYIVHEDWSGANEQAGVIPTYVYAGRYKVEGNFDEPLGDEAREALQREVDDFYALFVDDVAAGRGTTTDAVRTGYGEGRVLTATRAVAEGLADSIGTLNDTVRRLSGVDDRRRRRGPADDPAPVPTAGNPDDDDVASRIAALDAEARHPSTL